MAALHVFYKVVNQRLTLNWEFFTRGGKYRVKLGLNILYLYL